MTNEKGPRVTSAGASNREPDLKASLTSPPDMALATGGVEALIEILTQLRGAHPHFPYDEDFAEMRAAITDLVVRLGDDLYRIDLAILTGEDLDTVARRAGSLMRLRGLLEHLTRDIMGFLAEAGWPQAGAR